LWLRDWIKGYLPYEEIALKTKAAGRTDVPIRFLGVWDTVAAYGIRSEILWPGSFDDLMLSPLVERACHALSLDDERTTFHPLVWDERAEDTVFKGAVCRGRITQVRFAGVHSNVGGGYPEDGLSMVSLEWMMGVAMASGLDLKKRAVQEFSEAKSPYAPIYDSHKGVAAYYRYGPRRIEIDKDNEGTPSFGARAPASQNRNRQTFRSR
jgi:uncharacterized protein (DUF2235 family)